MMGLLGSLFLTGLLGSLGHCLGMCGPLVVMVGLQFRARKPAVVPSYLLYHGSRLAVYALLGAVAGGVGSVLGISGGLAPVAGIASLLVGLAIILLGVGYLGWLPLGRLEGSSQWLSRAMSRALERGGALGAPLLGALNGLLPCGLVYSALLVAATAGGPMRGAAGMAVFGLATVPALLLVGLGAGALGTRWRQALLRLAGAFIVLVGIQLALRGLASLDIVPHLKLWGVMVW
jgi:sulfite exporter TauE/SafE